MALRKKILYFVEGVPSAEQRKEADQLGASIRNASAYHEGDFVERADEVYGAAPKAYGKKYDVKPAKAGKAEAKPAAKASAKAGKAE